MRNHLFLKNITINKSIHNVIYSTGRSNSIKTRKITSNHCTFSTTMLDRSSCVFRVQTFTCRFMYFRIAIRTFQIVLWFIAPQYSFPFINSPVSMSIYKLNSSFSILWKNEKLFRCSEVQKS